MASLTSNPVLRIILLLPLLLLLLSWQPHLPIPIVSASSTHRTPIILSSTGGFSTGGKTIVSPTDPNATLTCDWGYMEYFIPLNARRTSIVMWHSATTQAFQNNWAGGEGFKDIFLRLNYPVYLWDGPRVGRANWACESTRYEPAYRDQGNFVAWNFGPSFGEWWPDVQFPARDREERWKEAARTRYVEYDTPRNLELETDAAVVAADSGRLGDSVVYVTNSASGLRAMLTATKSRTDNIKAIVNYETIGLVFPDDADTIPPGSHNPALAAFDPYVIPAEKFDKLTRLAVVQFVWGDHREEFEFYNQSRLVMDLINHRGGTAEFLRLAEDEGLVGSTHSPFADVDNHKVAGLLQDLLRRYGLDGYKKKKERRWLALW